MPKIYMSIQLGPMVKIEIEGDNCPEITEALHGFEHLQQDSGCDVQQSGRTQFTATDAPMQDGGKARS